MPRMTETETLRNVSIRLRIISNGPTVFYRAEDADCAIPHSFAAMVPILVSIHLPSLCRKTSKNLESIKDYLRIPVLGQG